ncbi:MAG: hypothetical protein JWM62_2916 [Frankiales bacterium]|nr:hypothetical protein [Frankiales bacterium]
MGKTITVSRLEDHPNLPEVLGVLAQLAHIGDDHLVALADAWVNSPALAQARDRALGPESPLVVEVLAAFDALSSLFADDLAGEADYVVVECAVTVRALKAVRDAIAAAYARPMLTRSDHAALLRPWRTVFPQPTVDEPDLGPRADSVKALLSLLPRLAGRCHDEDGQALFDVLVDRSFVAEADRADAAQSAFQAAVLTSRRRVWALVRRTGTEGLLRPCTTCRGSVTPDRDTSRVLELCLDAACALLVADAVPDACTDLLAEQVLALIPAQRPPS